MAEDWRQHYQRWAAFAALDAELREQLNRMRDDEKALQDCFYKPIEFGTGGLRGELGPGINRINLYTVRKASEGLARYVSEQGEQAKQRGVAIAYDSRHKSREFAMEAAGVLGKHGIRVHVFDRLCPTPLLSFAVRHLGACAGIVITASHNPPEYNGYKVYGPDGGQVTPTTAERMMHYINGVQDELTVEIADKLTLLGNGLLRILDNGEMTEAYLERVKSIRMPASAAPPINIVFTPLHGTTYEPIMKGLKAFGFDQVTVVREQADPDPDFSTVDSPNPEEHQAFELAMKYGMEAAADLILGTDPDGDRLGVAVRDRDGQYVMLTGNQIGSLLLHYLLSERQKRGGLPPNGVVLKTIVTSEMGRAIAADFGLTTVDTLTGFKYIGEKIGEYEKTGEYVFQFGYEESYGFLIGDFVRDKDAVQTALIMADACASFKAQGRSLYDMLLLLYEKFGYYREDLYSLTLKGKQGMETISAIMSSLRSHPLTEIAGKNVTAMEDYLTGERRDVRMGRSAPLTQPKSDVIKVQLEDDSWFCVRPSGTEPKLKIYFGVRGTTLEDAEQRLGLLKQALINRIESS